MEKIVLIGINSQYIHTNLAIRYLKKYVEKYSNLKIKLYETNINSSISQTLIELFKLEANHYIFSIYIWNKDYIFTLIKELKKVKPDIKISLGGPEVSFNAEQILTENPEINYILVGEGERVLLNFLTSSDKNIKGVATLKNGSFSYLGNEELITDLDTLPFPYEDEELGNNIKILYYETTRGCPFSCSYCLSSVDKKVRYLSIERVKSDLKKFIDSGVELVKFVDRTYNLRKDRYLSIWKFLLENYREGITFHFEINANIFDDDTIEFLKQIPRGFFQFEIGVQSINEETMRSIERFNNLERLKNNVLAINKNIHLHLDLIAGLPYDSYEKFKSSFNYVYSLAPEMIQLGFLKILKGTKLAQELEKYNYKHMNFPPYEIISNDFISFNEIIRLKNIEKVLDFYYNSEKFKYSISHIIEKNYQSAFDFFEDISFYFEKRGLLTIGHKSTSLFQYLLDFYIEKNFKNLEIFKEYLKFDYLFLGKPGSHPEWFISEKDKEKHNQLISDKNFKSIREAHKKTEFEKFKYNIFENKDETVEILFNYEKNLTSIEIFKEKV